MQTLKVAREHFLAEPMVKASWRSTRWLGSVAPKGAVLMFLALFIPLAGNTAEAQNKTVPEAFVVEPPTLRCIGLEWDIQGDDNRNCTVAVSYRPQGAKEWKKAQDMLRIQREITYKLQTKQTYQCGNMFAGSIFGLQPDTLYEVKCVLNDPDGGQAEKVAEVKTRAEPKAYAGGTNLHVYPVAFKGAKKSPSFENIAAAYEKASAGDIILIHAGTYQGPFVFTKSGTPEKPIVFQGAGDGETILVGTGTTNLIDAHGADYLFFDNLTIRDPGTGDGGSTVDGVAILAGNYGHEKAGCKGLVVQRCRFEDFGVGIMAADGLCRNFYIADNVFAGRRSMERGEWEHAGKGDSWTAVWIGGQGHAVCYNKICNVWDGIDVSGTGAHPSMGRDRHDVAIDIYNNEIVSTSDDFVETDHGTHNVRVFDNYCLNSGHCGLSAQTFFGGPVYFIRNVVYNVGCNFPKKQGQARPSPALKFNCEPAGLIVYHNTVFGFVSASEWENGHFRNNLFLVPEKTYSSGSLSRRVTFDYNGYLGEAGNVMFTWTRLKEPDSGKLEGFLQCKTEAEARKFNGSLPKEQVACKTLKEVYEKLGFEKHGKIVDYGIFRKVAAPSEEKRMYRPEELDFGLKTGSVAEDAGVVLPTINEDFAGKAPDLGALESGRSAPHYGPRN